MTDQTTRKERIAEARQSYTGSRLTDQQFLEAWQITGILHREIHHSGSFRDKLTDYAHAFARAEKFDAVKGEAILRDIFTARYGQSLNQVREGLIEREAVVRDAAQDQALQHAQSVAARLQEAPGTPFYKAYDAAAVDMARQHGITEAGAKVLMTDSFKAAQGQDLYAYGKSLEQHHRFTERPVERTLPQMGQRYPTRSGPRR